MKSVYCAVRTGSLNKAICASSLKGGPDWGFTVVFLSCKVNARAKLMQRRGTARTPHPQAWRPHLNAWIVNFHCNRSPVWVQNPDSQPTKVKAYLPTKYSASFALVFCITSQGPQLDYIPLALAYPTVRVMVSVSKPSNAIKRRNG
jgi:hypothetical protein